MKQTKTIISFLILNILLDVQILNGQILNQGSRVTVQGSDDLLYKLRLNANINANEKIPYSSISGDPFLYKDFVPGQLVLKTGEALPLILRYDIFTCQIQFKQNDEVFSIINPGNISLVMVDSFRFQFVDYLKAPGDLTSIENSWLILKTDGKCKLFIKKNIRLQAAELPKPYQAEKPATFIHNSDTYYLKLQGKSAVKIDNKKDLLNALADKKDELTGFINNNRLGVKEGDDLAKIISFYNSL